MRDGFWVGILGDFGVFSAVGDVWTEATVKDFDAIAKVSDIFLGFGLEFGGVELAGLFQGDGVRVFGLNGDEELANLDVWAKAADVGLDVLSVFGLSDDTRQLEHF